MKTLFTLLFISTLSLGFSQTTVYTTGQTYTDAWTGWSTPVVTNITGSSVNGINIYSFTGNASDVYSLEITRQFNIASTDIDFYLAATAQNADLFLEYSTDGTNYSNVGTQAYGGVYGQSTLVVPTWNPGVSSFYLKIRVMGTFGSPSSVQLNNLKIDADLTGAGILDFDDLYQMNYADSKLTVNAALADYKVSIYDITGQLIHVESALTNYDFTTQHQGVYLVSIESSNGNRKTIKVVNTK